MMRPYPLQAYRRATLLALLSVASLSMLGSRCDTSSVLPSPTYDFVVSSIVVDANDTSPAAGFNLDGLYSDVELSSGCFTRDRLSEMDLDQNDCSNPMVGCIGGVDNSLPAIAAVMDTHLQGIGSAVQDRIANELSNGRLVLLMRLSEVENFVNDPHVSLALYQGYSADASCASLFGGNGKFYVARDSLASPDEIDQPLWRADGEIVSGRLRVRYGTSSGLAWEAPAGVPLSQMRLRMTLDPNGEAGETGNLGGWMQATWLRDVLARWYPRFRIILNDTIPSVADLPHLSSGACGGDYAYPIGGVGFGIHFSVARGIIIGIATQPSADACGHY